MFWYVLYVWVFKRAKTLLPYSTRSKTTVALPLSALKYVRTYLFLSSSQHPSHSWLNLTLETSYVAEPQAAQSLGSVTELRLLLQHGGRFEYLNI